MVNIKREDLMYDLSPDEWAELNRASELEPVFDSDSPEMTEEMLLQFHPLNKMKADEDALVM